jgi:tRNA U34 2-thiouridine synthase MnmA/TrmU
MVGKKGQVFIALRGGVDGSTAAVLMQQKGAAEM